MVRNSTHSSAQAPSQPRESRLPVLVASDSPQNLIFSCIQHHSLRAYCVPQLSWALGHTLVHKTVMFLPS